MRIPQKGGLQVCALMRQYHDGPRGARLLSSVHGCAGHHRDIFSARNASNFKATLLYKHQVSFGWCPYTQLFIEVMDQMSLSFGRVLGGGEEVVRKCNCREHCVTFNIGKLCQDLFPDNARIRSCTMTSDGDYGPELFGVPG